MAIRYPTQEVAAWRGDSGYSSSSDHSHRRGRRTYCIAGVAPSVLAVDARRPLFLFVVGSHFFAVYAACVGACEHRAV